MSIFNVPSDDKLILPFGRKPFGRFAIARDKPLGRRVHDVWLNQKTSLLGKYRSSLSGSGPTFNLQNDFVCGQGGQAAMHIRPPPNFSGDFTVTIGVTPQTITSGYHGIVCFGEAGNNELFMLRFGNSTGWDLLIEGTSGPQVPSSASYDGNLSTNNYFVLTAVVSRTLDYARKYENGLQVGSDIDIGSVSGSIGGEVEAGYGQLFGSLDIGCDATIHWMIIHDQALDDHQAYELYRHPFSSTLIDLDGSPLHFDAGAGADNLLAENVESLSELTTPAIGQEHALLAADVESASEVTTPVLAEVSGDVLLAENVESASELTVPTFGQEHALLAEDIQSLSEVGVPTLGHIHILVPVSVESASEVTAPVFTEVVGGDNLLAEDVESASEVTTPSIGQIHTLLTNNVQSISQVSNPVLFSQNLLSWIEQCPDDSVWAEASKDDSTWTKRIPDPIDIERCA